MLRAFLNICTITLIERSLSWLIFYFIFFQMKTLLTCACISMVMKNVIRDILLDPAARNHYLFHYILSGTGTLLADDTKGITQNYQIRSGQGFMIFPGQVTTYIADSNVPWEYLWVEFDGLRITEALSMTDFSKNKPVYHPHNKELRDKLADELMYISHHPKESPFHLIGHLYLFLDYLIQSAHSTQLLSNNKNE